MADDGLRDTIAKKEKKKIQFSDYVSISHYFLYF
jgi:hypothetical protein